MNFDFYIVQKTTFLLILILYTDGSHMFVSHSGIISTPSSNIPNAYLVPKISLNFISIVN